MIRSQKGFLVQAVLLVLIAELGFLGLGWLVQGGPHSMEGIPAPNPTVVIGAPDLEQLLAAGHSVSPLRPESLSARDLIPSTLLTFVYLFVNGAYIALLARSVQGRSSTVFRDALRAWPTLLGWMLLQLIPGLLTALLTKIGHYALTQVPNSFKYATDIPFLYFLALPAMLSGIFLFWFRYHFLLLEYAVVILRLPLVKALKQSVQLRHSIGRKTLGWFFLNLLANIILSFVLNFWFSWPTLFVILFLHIIVQTLMQRWLITQVLCAANENGELA